MIQSVTLKLSEVLPNPFRNLGKYPLDTEKIEALQRSIENTKFWSNVAVRVRKDSKYELVYGHHRIAAAIKAGIKEHDFIVETLDDSEMLSWLAADNADVYGKNYTWSVLEAVEGVVIALADGRIKPFVVDEKTRKDFIRYAPSFIPGKVSEAKLASHPYTTADVARQLGYTKSMSANRDSEKANDKATAALGALYLMELGQLKPELIKDWTVDKLVTETRARIAAYKDTVVRREQDKEKQRQLREQFEKEKQHNKAEAERLRLENEALLEKERAARKEKAEVDAIKFAEERKENERRREQREAEFKTKRAEFDEKIEEIKLDAQKAKERDRDLPTRHAVKAMLFKLNTITSERFAFREEVKLMAQDKAVTTNERELLRQAMMRAGDWYIEQSNVFLPKPAVNVLAEARQKEEAKRKGRGANEQE